MERFYENLLLNSTFNLDILTSNRIPLTFTAKEIKYLTTQVKVKCVEENLIKPCYPLHPLKQRESRKSKLIR